MTYNLLTSYIQPKKSVSAAKDILKGLNSIMSHHPQKPLQFASAQLFRITNCLPSQCGLD